MGSWFLDETNWGGAVVRVPWQMYRVYGDTKTMRENYGAMVKWLDYEATAKAGNNGNIRGLGDWASGQETTAQAIIDYGYYENVSTMVKVAQVLGKSADVEMYLFPASLKRVQHQVAAYRRGGACLYANNTQASNAVALDAGLAPGQYHEAVGDSLVESVSAFGNRIGTGSVGLGPLFGALHAAGRDDLLYQMVINPLAPSSRSRSTRAGRRSARPQRWRLNNHHFFGQVASWFVHDLAGIAQAPD